MKGLIIDTAGKEALVALVEEEKVIRQQTWQADKELGLKMLEAIQALLEEGGVNPGDLGRIGVVVTAKDRYMGLRTGISVANALSLGWRIPIVELESGPIETIIIQLLSNNVKEVAQAQYLDENTP